MITQNHNISNQVMLNQAILKKIGIDIWINKDTKTEVLDSYLSKNLYKSLNKHNLNDLNNYDDTKLSQASNLIRQDSLKNDFSDKSQHDLPNSFQNNTLKNSDLTNSNLTNTNQDSLDNNLIDNKSDNINLDYLVSKKYDNTNNSYSNIFYNNFDNNKIKDNIKNQANNLQINTLQSSNYLDSIALLSNTFSLTAIRVKNWILIADDNMMATQDKSLFANLSKKLTQKNASIYQASYPIDKSDNQQNFIKEQAFAVLSGFLFGLIKNDEKTVKIGILTPLMDIQLGDLNRNVVHIPSLTQMYYRPEFRKILWDKLHE